MTGAPQGPLKSAPVRQVMTPRPYDAPTINPAFFTLGRTMTHSDLFNRPVGIPLSAFVRSFITLPDSVTRCSSLALSSAALTNVGKANPSKATDRHNLAAKLR